MYSINIASFILISLIVYSSSFLGYYLYRLAKDEVENNIVLLKTFLKTTFFIINFLFYYNVFKQNNFFLILIILSILIIVLKAKLELNMYFLYLAIIYSLSYFYDLNFYYMSILIFIYNLTATSLESTKKSLKKILIKKLGFFIITLIAVLWYLIL